MEVTLHLSGQFITSIVSKRLRLKPVKPTQLFWSQTLSGKSGINIETAQTAQISAAPLKLKKKLCIGPPEVKDSAIASSNSFSCGIKRYRSDASRVYVEPCVSMIARIRPSGLEAKRAKTIIVSIIIELIPKLPYQDIHTHHPESSVQFCCVKQ
ncbi:hypothetical protein PGT21_011969 [Puccinia graminis f. sp. tritici]|uniref:Uncharacterized protein n=1 Tax=Puccinia graminis f. sp. tritici TaxID=56615 RepID=A0A5B0NDD2_PUCGR|nr:hypothetical protein PGT21_011969 [Puccinia graminis f. sp. tritici]